MGKVKILIAVIGLLFLGITSYAQSTTEYPSFAPNNIQLENRIQIYPNPSVDFLKVTIEESNLVDPQIVVHSIIGSTVNVVSEKTSVDEFTVNVKDLPAGYYLLAVKDETTGFSKTYKFLKR